MSGAATAIAIGAGVGGAGSIFSGIMGSNAAENAASQQSQAADRAAQLQYQASQNALDFTKQQYGNSQAEMAPWLQSGAGALTNLDYLLGIGQPSSTTPGANNSPGAGGTGTGTSPINLASSPNPALGNAGSLLQAYPGGDFKAPTAQDMQENDPGYQARLNLGTQALQQSAAARGNLLTGGTAKAVNQYAQDYASNEYSNYYNQAYNTHANNYNQYQNQQTNTYNRLASLAGAGQTTASTLGTLGANASGNVSSNLLGTAAQMGQDYQNAGAANASGIVGGANAWNSAIQGGTSSISNILLLNSLLGKQSQGTAQPVPGGYDV